MPYITEHDRFEYNRIVDEVIREMNRVDVLSKNCWKGHLNYFVSKLCHKIIEEKGLRYHNLNDVMGVLDCVKQEFYRTVAAPYEEEKKEENGSVSELDE